MLIVFVETALAQGLFPVAVSVSILLPAPRSAALGKYVHKVSEVGLVKVPVPLEVQSTPAVLVALAPAVIFTAPLVEQVVIAVPATAVAGALITTLAVLLVAMVELHPPEVILVIVIVVDPTFKEAVVNEPVPGLPVVNVIEAVFPVLVVLPVKL
jgi:hypothetical protein